MQSPIKLGLQVVERVFGFLGKTELTAALGPVDKQVATLGAVIERLSGHAVQQDESNRAFKAGAREASRLAVALRKEYMRPIAELAQTLFPKDQSMLEALGMPRVRSYEGLIAAALAMAGRVEEHKARFIEVGGLEADFVDRLKQAVQRLKDERAEKQSHYGRRSAATAGMVEELARGRKLVKLLDTMIAPRLVENPSRLAEWKTLSRFKRTAPDEEKPTIPQPTPPAGPPTPPPVTPNPPPIAGGDAVRDRAA
jgi:hypothetical protein